MTTDRISHVLETIEGMFLTFGSAVRAASAVSTDRTPAAADLTRLGIDPAAFGEICRP